MGTILHPIVTIRVSIEVGRLRIYRVARQLRDFFHEEGLEYGVEVDPGWPKGSVRFSVTGTEDKVEQAVADVEEWAK
jgi:hypothetical protein